MKKRKETATSLTLLPLPCACANLRRATRAVSQLYAAEMRRVGLVGTQYTLLSVLARADQVTQGRLGELLAVDSTTLTRTLAPLRARRWIDIRRGRDRRERHLRLTNQGRQQYQRAQRSWQRAQERLRAKLGEEEWGQLLQLLPRVTQAAREA